MSEENEKKDDDQQLSVNIDEETSLGIYSNLALSNFSKEEFYLDFAFIQPHSRKGKIRSRVILSPRNAKRLSQILLKNINDYESKFGDIDENNNPSTGIKLSFN